MKITQSQIIAGPEEYVVLLGPIRGTVTTAEGEVVNVDPIAVAVGTPEQAAEVAHLVSLRFDAEGHPAHDDANPFSYDPPEQFLDYVPHPDNTTITAGEPVGLEG